VIPPVDRESGANIGRAELCSFTAPKLIHSGKECPGSMIEEVRDEKIIDTRCVHPGVPSGKDREGFDLRSYRKESFGREPIVERLNPETVAGDEQFLFLSVIDDERPHAVEVVKTITAPVCICGEENLCIAFRGESVSISLEFEAEFLIVIYLSVIHDPVSPVRRAHRLMAGGCGVYDGEAAVTER